MSLEIKRGFHALNMNLRVVLVHSILVTKSKRSKASTSYTHSMLFGLKVLKGCGGTSY